MTPYRYYACSQEKSKKHYMQIYMFQFRPAETNPGASFRFSSLCHVCHRVLGRRFVRNRPLSRNKATRGRLETYPTTCASRVNRRCVRA